LLWLTMQDPETYVTPDGVYRIRFERDPWAQPGDKGVDTWLIERRTRGTVYTSAARKLTLNEAREFIDADMSGPVFTNDRLSGSNLAACRWCDTFEIDMDDEERTWKGCNLCEREIAWRKGMMFYAQ